MHKLKNFVIIISTLIFSFISLYNIKKVEASTNRKQITYQAHVQNISWQKDVLEGEMAGTTSKALQMEAIKINNSNSDFKIKYQVHIENLGWQNWKEQGQIAGTTGRALQLEAIKIELEDVNNKYSIRYRVHIEELGWQDWKQDGQIAGTTGKALRLEAIEIQIIEKGNMKIEYISHIEEIGWENTLNYDGATSGTTGRNLRNEAVKINLINAPSNAQVNYRVYIANRGWQSYKQNGQVAGTTGQALRLEAIQIKLVNLENYNVEYRTHLENIGWQDWKQNGETSGIVNSGLKIEAIQIKLTLKENKNENDEVDKDETNKDENDEIEDEVKLLEGIDVSHHQGTIDWKKVKNDNIDFAIIRAGFRGYGASGSLNKDTKFDYNIKNALANNIDVGIYFFSQAVTVEEAIEEANYTLELIRGYNITYPVIIDVEYANEQHTGRADGVSKEMRTNIVIAFCEKIKEAGYIPMFYTDKWFLANNLDVSRLQNYEYWLAHYTGATRDNPLLKPSDYKGNYSMWQYTAKGQVNGINTNVDLNIGYKKY